ncbi:MAG: hypothetical protein IPI55_07370 [Flavobacteriales bacterium]|nr:hypothetical protein [Flavobacteriales bacterium]
MDKLEPVLRKHTAQDAVRLGLLTEVATAYVLVRLDTAILFATQAITLAERLVDEKAAAQATAIRGTAEVFRGDLSTGRSDLLAALEASERMNHLPGELQAHTALMHLGNLQGRETDADKEFGSAMSIATVLRDTAAMVELLTLQGGGLSNRGLQDRSLELLDRAMAIGTAYSEPTSLALSFATRGFTRACLGDLDGAATDIDTAFVLAGATGDRYAMAMAFCNQGSLNWYRSNMPKALEAYLISLRWAERLDDRTNMVNTMGNIGKVYAVMGDFHNSKEYAVRSAAMAKNLGLYMTLMNSTSDIGYAGLGSGDRDACFAAYNEMARLADSLNNQEYLVEADICLAEAYLAFDMADSAVAHAVRGASGAVKLAIPPHLGERWWPEKGHLRCQRRNAP